MGFIESTLLKDEKIIFAVRPHWNVFVLPAVLLFVALLVQLGVIPLSSSFRVEGFSLQSWMAFLILLAAVVSLFNAWVIYGTSEYGVTNKRVLMKIGLVRRVSIELFLDKIEAIYVDQTIAGRILDFGTIVIVGTGGSRDPFANIPDPLGFRKIAQQQIDSYKK